MDLAAIRRATCFALFILCAAPSPALSAWQPNGIPVAPVGPGIEQFIPNLCTDGAHGAYVSWKEESSTDQGDAYLQRVTGEGDIAFGWPIRGLRIGFHPSSEFICNLAPDMSGGVYIVWWTGLQSGLEYKLLRLLPNGIVAPGWPSGGLILPVGSSRDRMDDLCGDGNGGIYIVWTSTDNEVFMLHYTGSGEIAPGWSSTGRRIIAEASTKGDARILPTGEGGILASWNDFRGGTGLGFVRYALKIDSSGEAAAGWPQGGVQVNSQPTLVEHTFMISDGAGGAYIGWNDNRNGVFPPNPLDYDLYGQHVLGNGTIDSRWPADGLPIAVAPSAQYFLEMAEDGSGGALVVWDDYRDGPQIFAVRIRPDGSVAPGWTPNGAPMAARPVTQTIPQAVSNLQGGVYGFWGETSIIVGQHLDGFGSPVSDWTASGKTIAGGDATYRGPPGAISDDQGGALVVYQRRTSTPDRTANVYIQRVFVDGPVPTLIAFFDSEVEPGRVRLRWSASDAPATRATVYRRQGDAPWIALGSATSVGESILEFEDQGLVAGRYAYRLGFVENGTEQFTEAAWIDVPSALSLSLAGFRPNPGIGTATVAFSLPDDRPAQLDVIDVKGRVVHSRDVGSLGGGSHVLSLANEAPLTAGMYWIRLTHPERTLTTKGLVVR